jgi:hypothetical protein
MAEYAYATGLVSKPSHETPRAAPQLTTPIRTQEVPSPKNRSDLPPGVREIINSDKKIILQPTSEGLPWLPKATEVPLRLVVMGTGERFYIGSCLEHRKIRKIVDQMPASEQRAAFRSLFAPLSEFLQTGDAKGKIGWVISKRTKLPIGYTSSGNQRAYMIRTLNLEGLPVIIHIGSCNKSHQRSLYSIISTEGY